MAIPDEVQAYLSRLEEKIELLEARLDVEKNLRRGPMRDTRRCPSCGHTKILFVERVGNQAMGFLALSASLWAGKPDGGIVQMFSCAGCGHSELQLDNIQKITRMKHVTELEPPPEREGPHR